MILESIVWEGMVRKIKGGGGTSDGVWIRCIGEGDQV